MCGYICLNFYLANFPKLTSFYWMNYKSPLEPLNKPLNKWWIFTSTINKLVYVGLFLFYLFSLTGEATSLCNLPWCISIRCLCIVFIELSIRLVHLWRQQLYFDLVFLSPTFNTVLKNKRLWNKSFNYSTLQDGSPFQSFTCPEL